MKSQQQEAGVSDIKMKSEQQQEAGVSGFKEPKKRGQKRPAIKNDEEELVGNNSFGTTVPVKEKAAGKKKAKCVDVSTSVEDTKSKKKTAPPKSKGAVKNKGAVRILFDATDNTVGESDDGIFFVKRMQLEKSTHYMFSTGKSVPDQNKIRPVTNTNFIVMTSFDDERKMVVHIHVLDNVISEIGEMIVKFY